MMSLFQTDIAAAKAKLSQATPTPKAMPTTNRQVFGSHRSGVDAFMTGFTFICYAIQSQLDAGEEREEGGVSVCGLADLRNCLASRPRSKQKMPLRIVRSQFAKNSNTFVMAKDRMDSLARELYTS